MKYFLFELTDPIINIDSIILAVFEYWHVQQIRSVFGYGTLATETQQNLRAWLLEKSPTLRNEFFTVAYDDEWFILWK